MGLSGDVSVGVGAAGLGYIVEWKGKGAPRYWGGEGSEQGAVKAREESGGEEGSCEITVGGGWVRWVWLGGLGRTGLREGGDGAGVLRVGQVGAGTANCGRNKDWEGEGGGVRSGNFLGGVG